MQLSNPEFRKEFIADMGAIIDQYVAAFRNSLGDDESVFTAVCNFPAEVIPFTVNGYQRFLSESAQSNNRASALAGFLINLCAQLKYTYGKELMAELQTDIFGSNKPIEAPGQQNQNAFSLWALAYQQSDDNVPPADYNALTAYLFLQRARWLLVRAKVGTPVDE